MYFFNYNIKDLYISRIFLGMKYLLKANIFPILKLTYRLKLMKIFIILYLIRVWYHRGFFLSRLVSSEDKTVTADHLGAVQFLKQNLSDVP